MKIQCPTRTHCPECGQSVSRIAISKLVYTYEPCNCGAWPYEHLAKTPHHKSCYVSQNTQTPSGTLQLE